MEKKASKQEQKKINSEDSSVAHFYELLKACNNKGKPNPKALLELQKGLKDNPVFQRMMKEQEDLYTITLQNKIEQSKMHSDSFKVIAREKCQQLREELGYESANKLEKLAIEQIVLCWLHFHQTELVNANILSQSNTLETIKFWENRLNFASRRYNNALETLSRMRRLNLTVQVNNAKNQIVNNV